MSDHKLRKSERLKRRKIIAALFEKGRSVHVYPVRIVWDIVDRDGRFPARVAFAVSRRSFRKAHDRNLLKRRMREAYRHEKHLLYDLPLPEGKQYAVICIYTGKEILAFNNIRRSLEKGLGRIVHA